MVTWYLNEQNSFCEIIQDKLAWKLVSENENFDKEGVPV